MTPHPSRQPWASALLAGTVLSACVTNPNKPDAANTSTQPPATSSSTAPAPTCERLPSMSNKQKVAFGAAAGAVTGALIGNSVKGNRGKHAMQGALGGALVGALAGSAFKNEIDVEEQPDGSVRLKIPGSLMFASGQYSLSPGFQSTLGNVTTTVKKYCDVTVRVVGYTDGVGTVQANQALSENRAKAVANHMQGGGFDRNRIRSEGRGAADPIATNADELGRQQNRRVEIFVRPPA